LKARAVTELSSAVAAGRLELESFTALDADAVLERLYALQGVIRQLPKPKVFLNLILCTHVVSWEYM
jgi:hypothetical protein